jgi:nitrate/nitrite transporter NarK
MDHEFLWVVFGVCTFIVISLELTSFISQRSSTTTSDEDAIKPQPSIVFLAHPFNSFRVSFLCVFYLMTLGDWLQGPYLYSLYESYGYSRDQIGWIFAVGYIASLLLGTPIGALAERAGRKKWGLLYVGLYSTACLLVHVDVTWVLVIGRVCSGVATSLLFRYESRR